MNDTSDKYANFSHDELVAEINRLKKHKKYGLVWEHKTEKVIEDFETQQPYLEEVTDKRIEDAPGEPTNLIIEGDNFEALSILNYTHAGKVDVIYIDPPYNTGNKDFIYNDNYVDSEDEFRHSKWLSFMEPRLKLAKNLLKDDGAIFISIDDREQSALKLLCDEIFGRDNFKANISWQRTYSPRNDSKGVSQETEYLLVYSKGLEWSPKKLPRTAEMDSKYKNPDGDDNPWTSSDAFAPSAATHQGMVYAIQHPFTGKMIYPYKGACWPLLQEKMFEEISKWGKYRYADLHDDEKRAEICGISVDQIRKNVPGIILEDDLEVARVKAQKIYDNGKWPKFYFTNKGYGGIRRKTYINSVSGKNVTNFWPHSEVGNTDQAQKEVKVIFGNKVFNTPKPVNLIKRIINISPEDNIILDFFAGSGTTGQAVLELNKEDGGHRQFILCTNNGDKGPDSAKIAEEITYPRIKTVITGERQDGSKYSDGIPANLRYYKINHREKKPSIDANRQDIVTYMENIIQVKENTYKQLEVNEDFAIYESSEKYVGLVFEPFSLEEVIANLKERNGEKRPVKLYVFSYSRDAFEDDYDTDFEIKFVAMPEGLLKTYAHIVEEQKKEDL